MGSLLLDAYFGLGSKINLFLFLLVRFRYWRMLLEFSERQEAEEVLRSRSLALQELTEDAAFIPLWIAVGGVESRIHGMHIEPVQYSSILVPRRRVLSRRSQAPQEPYAMGLRAPQSSGGQGL
jgi:hypothetical protein